MGCSISLEIQKKNLRAKLVPFFSRLIETIFLVFHLLFQFLSLMTFFNAGELRFVVFFLHIFTPFGKIMYVNFDVALIFIISAYNVTNRNFLNGSKKKEICLFVFDGIFDSIHIESTLSKAHSFFMLSYVCIVKRPKKKKQKKKETERRLWAYCFRYFIHYTCRSTLFCVFFGKQKKKKIFFLNAQGLCAWSQMFYIVSRSLLSLFLDINRLFFM